VSSRTPPAMAGGVISQARAIEVEGVSTTWG
jgi:hypothetical protein